MAVQVITPQQESFDLHVSLPKEYLGRQVHCLFYIEEEAKSVAISPVPATKPPQKKRSDFAGIFTQKEADSFEKHTQRTRKEWDRTS